jgi:uncharacterized membrane protein YgaE (UPF0421/DUF939 family)
MTYDADEEGFDEGPPVERLSPKRVLRIILPSFVISVVLAVVGVALFVSGYHTVGMVLVIVAAVGGLLVRGRLVYRAQMGGRPPSR